jgi:hypothetical protein
LHTECSRTSSPQRPPLCSRSRCCTWGEHALFVVSPHAAAAPIWQRGEPYLDQEHHLMRCTHLHGTTNVQLVCHVDRAHHRMKCTPLRGTTKVEPVSHVDRVHPRMKCSPLHVHWQSASRQPYHHQRPHPLQIQSTPKQLVPGCTTSSSNHHQCSCTLLQPSGTFCMQTLFCMWAVCETGNTTAWL